MDGSWRLGVFVALFVLLALAEQFWPQRQRQTARWQRWSRHLSLSLLNLGLIRLVLAGAAVGSAQWASSQGWGLLPLLNLPIWLHWVLGLTLLDLSIYWQHRLFHHWQLLWRLHRVHHADPELDVSTGIRFHPVEALVSMLLKIAMVLLLGVGPALVLVFELWLNACSLFNHSNLRLPAWLEPPLRRLLITPALHTIHHSRRCEEQNSNFGFSIPWWDWCFGSYRASAHLPPATLPLGDSETPELSQQLGSLLFEIPLKKVSSP